jgi:hypothetical protein
MRWFASWVLFAAYWPIIILYLVWIPLTIMGKFPRTARESILDPSDSLKRETLATVNTQGHASVEKDPL